jgi:hypothetical protein
MTPRRFSPPWSIEESSACFIVRDHDKQALAYVYYVSPEGPAGPSQFFVAGVGDFFSSSSSCFSSAGRLATSWQLTWSPAACF